MPDWGAAFRATSKQILESLIHGRRTLTELSTELGVTKPTLLRYLNDLVGLGLVRKHELRTTTGREVAYELVTGSLHVEVRPDQGAIVTWAAAGFVSEDFPLVNQVPQERPRRDLDAVLTVLRRDVAPEVMGGLVVLVYGSVARGEANTASDLDVGILAAQGGAVVPKDDVLGALSDPFMELHHPLRPRVLDRGALLTGETAYHREILEEAVILHAPPTEVELWSRLKAYKRTSI